MAIVAVLYAKAGTAYRQIAGIDVWDEVRDARLFPGGCPVIAHPPCRAWGRFAHRAKAKAHEMDLAFHAVRMVRRWGGVLEHPACSKLWNAAGLPRPGEAADEFGGYSIAVNQVDWGHRALKPTWLYILGVERDRLPYWDEGSGVPVTTVERMWRGEREATPFRFAMWLVHLASRVGVPFQGA